jgi:putative tricarboxylic transport membrane protein
MDQLRPYDYVWGFFWFLVGLALCYGSTDLELGELRQPGSGFIPLLLGIALAFQGLGLVISASRQRKLREEGKRGRTIALNISYAKLSIFVSILLLYTVMLEDVGFVLSAFVLLFLLFKFISPGKWVKPITLSLPAVLITYIVFTKWLDVQLPRGIFGF